MRPNVLLLISALLATGCASTSNGADQWAGRYAKPGLTDEQLRNDGLDCVPASAKALMFVSLWASNVAADAHQHQACMVAKGYTVKAMQ
jgi:hypothetical protein